MKKFLCFVAFVFSMKLAVADTASNFMSEYVTRGWTSEDGLPANAITDVIQDVSGYMYFGTYGGMVRFDGADFSVYNRDLDEKYN